MRIIEIQSGKKKLELVAGLIWHPLQSSGSARSKEVLGYAQAGSADLKVIRGVESPHVGLAKKLDGGKVGQLSVAAVIADALAAKGHRNVLVAMSLPDDKDSYVFVSVRDTVILADGDAIGTREEIRLRLVGDVAYGGWDIVLCPTDWGVRDAEDRDFNSFFSSDDLKNVKQWQLKETTIDWRKVTIPAALLIAVVIGVYYGWHVWQDGKIKAAAALVLEQEEIARNKKLVPVEPPKPWPLMPSAQVFVQACDQAFRKVGVSAGNWKLDGVLCENGLLTVKWSKPNENAWISHLKLVRPDAVISTDGMSATVTVYADAAPSNDFTTLPSAVGLNLRYYDLASRYGMVVRIDPVIVPAAPAVLPGQPIDKVPPVVQPSWVAIPLYVMANFDPTDVASVIDYLGLRFTKLVYAFKEGAIQYQFTGVQYVNP